MSVKYLNFPSFKNEKTFYKGKTFRYKKPNIKSNVLYKKSNLLFCTENDSKDQINK